MQIFTSKAPPLDLSRKAAVKIKWSALSARLEGVTMNSIDSLVETFERRRKYYFEALPINWRNLRTPADWKTGFNGCAEYEVLAFVSPYPPQIIGSVFETPGCDLDAAARDLISIINPDLEVAEDNYWYMLLPKPDILAAPPVVLEQLFSGAYWKIKEWRSLPKKDLNPNYARPFSNGWKEIVLRQAPADSRNHLSEVVAVDATASLGGTSRRTTAITVRTSDDMHLLGIQGDLNDINTHVRIN